MYLGFLITALTVLVSAAAEAHVVVLPLESAVGATETYTMRVPAEGNVATTSVELTVPDGVAILSVEAPATSYRLNKDGDRIVTITWDANIPPGESQAFVFVARNPIVAGEIAWKARQFLADGTSNDWIEPVGSRRPASLTKINQPSP